MIRESIVLAAGGTGGHVFPAEAVATELRARGYDLVLVTDSRGAAWRGALADVRTERLRAGTPLAGAPWRRVAALADVAAGLAQAHRLLRSIRPAAAVGFGGYAALPTMLAASWSGIPTLLHEQNAVLGRTNRLLARRMRRIALSFAVTARLRPDIPARVDVVGNPTRPEVGQARVHPYTPPTGDGPARLLVLGGSQGASVFSQVVPAALALLPLSLRARLRVAQQCRPENLEETQRRFAEAGVSAEVSTFFADVPTRLADAHIVLCRAGASTVAEVQVVGRPAILVPLPGAMDDHQTANARAVADAGGGWLMPQAEFTPESLAALLERLLSAPPRALETAAGRSRCAGRPDAAAALAAAAESLLARRPERRRGTLPFRFRRRGMAR